MDKHTAETLGDEERSFDSADESRSNISNFLDSQEDEVMSDHEPEVDEFLNSTKGGETVPILSISEPQRGDGIKKIEEEGEGFNEPRGGTGRGPSFATGSSQGGKEGSSETMRRSDMDSSGATGPRPFSLPPLPRISNGAGQVTRADGLIGQSREQQEGDKTQHLTAMTARMPATKESEDAKKTGPLGQSQSLKKPPLPTIEVNGGVEMFWEQVSEGTEEDELSPFEERQREMADLQREEGEAYMDLQTAVARMQALARSKNSLFMELGESGIAQMREELLRPEEDGGSLMRLLVLRQDLKEALNISQADWSSRLLEQVYSEDEAYQRAWAPASFSAQNVAQMFRGIQDRIEGEGERFLPPNSVRAREFAERNKVLAEGLASVQRIPAKLAALFPQEKALEIMQWYVRLQAGGEEMSRQWARIYNQQEVLEGLLGEYPGPRMPEAPNRTPVRTTVPMTGGRYTTSIDQATGVSPLTEKVGEIPRGMGLLGVRQEAARAGRAFRMGGVPEGGDSVHGEPKDVFWTANGNGVRETSVYDLPPGLVRSRGGEEDLRRGPTSVPSSRFSVHSSSRGEYSDEYLPAGFGGDNRETILEELGIAVSEDLAIMGKATVETEKLILENIPDFDFRTKARSTATRDFLKVAKDIKPDASENYINLGEWWTQFTEVGNDQGWSVAMRFRFLARTGGLKEGVHEAYRVRVKTMVKNIKEWLPEYESTKSEEEGRYWLSMWVALGLKMIKEFHQIQPTEKIEEGLVALMAEEKYRISSEGKDPLNSQFHKVDSGYGRGAQA